MYSKKRRFMVLAATLGCTGLVATLLLVKAMMLPLHDHPSSPDGSQRMNLNNGEGGVMARWGFIPLMGFNRTRFPIQDSEKTPEAAFYDALEKEVEPPVHPVLRGIKGQLAEDLTWHEENLLPFLVPAEVIGVKWSDIGGCQEVMTQILKQVVYPLEYASQHPELLHPLMVPPKGVLLYGPPGCGKTTVAKAVATEVQANFLNVDISAVKNKFLGETEKQAAAIFSLARKIQPCVIFLDEVDSFLGTRNATDHATDAALKSIFLQHWDGLLTEADTQVLILAATNRRETIDPAILRRLPLQFEIPKPGVAERRQILGIHLQGIDLAPDVDLDELARQTEGMSGSDLHELCRNACVSRLTDYMKQEGDKCGQLRPLTMDDLLDALQVNRGRPPSSLSSSTRRQMYC